MIEGSDDPFLVGPLTSILHLEYAMNDCCSQENSYKDRCLSASSTGAKHLKYFLAQQQQQNQTVKNISSTSQGALSEELLETSYNELEIYQD